MTRFIPVIARLGKGIRMKSDQTSEQGENASGESLAVKLAAGRAAVNELAKLLNTLDCDNLTAKSYAVLQDWLQQYCDLADVSPFCEIYRAIMRIVKARSLTTSTYLESTDFCLRFSREDGPLILQSRDIRCLRLTMESLDPGRQLQGQQLEFLKEWLKYHAALSQKEPFNEIYQDVLNYYFHKRLSAERLERLLSALFKIDTKISIALENIQITEEKQSFSLISDIFGGEKTISLKNAHICLAGEMKAFSSLTWQKCLADFGAHPEDTVSSKVCYLVVGGHANPCWEYAVYSSKVKEALKQQKTGTGLEIIMESSLYRTAFLQDKHCNSASAG